MTNETTSAIDLVERLLVASGRAFPNEEKTANEKLMAQAADTITRLQAALKGVEPYLDAIVCYASTMDEHEPNRIAFNVREVLKSVGGE